MLEKNRIVVHSDVIEKHEGLTQVPQFARGVKKFLCRLIVVGGRVLFQLVRQGRVVERSPLFARGRSLGSGAGR